MKIAVIGAGAIGGLVAGFLKLKGHDVSLVGHPQSVEAIRKNGLKITGVKGNLNVSIEITKKLNFAPDLAILATKSQNLKEAVSDNAGLLKNATVVTAQNGVQADQIVSEFISKENIVSSIVMFGATSLQPGEVVYNFERPWVIGKMFSKNDGRVVEASNVLNKAFVTIVTDEIIGMKYLKVFVNSNNCIPAILGTSMQESFSDLEVSRVSINIWQEGLEVIKKAGINLVSLPDFPLERVTQLTAMPSMDAAKIFSGIMRGLSKEPMYGSILQSIKRGKSSEIDYINGEFVALAGAHNAKAPLNEKLVAMVHEVESTGKYFNKADFFNAAKGLVN